MDHLEKGTKLIEQLWFNLARRIVLLAGKHYNWTEDEWNEATSKFLRPNDYKVIPV